MLINNASRINVEYGSYSHWLFLGVDGPVVIIGSPLLELEMVWLVAGVGASE